MSATVGPILGRGQQARLARRAVLRCALAGVAVTLVGAAAGASSLPAAARAGALPTELPAISWGVADDMPKYADDGGAWFYGEMHDANLTVSRWTLAWDPRSPSTIVEEPMLEHAAPVAEAAGVRVVLVLYSGNPRPLARNHPPGRFCAWAGRVAALGAQWGIHDFVVGNEPNTALYWAPQKNKAGRDVAAAPYEALLAKCYDTIHAADPDANVIGMGLSPRASRPKTSNEPLAFLRDVGAAYRKSDRRKPIMDQLALHPYPNPARKGSPPAAGYAKPDEYGISQLARVKQAVWDAFHGTGQPTTLNGLTFRLDEVGWQTDTTSYPQYVGTETWPQVISEQAQAVDIRTMVTRYFACDPTVTDVELFLLVDEKYRDGRDEFGTLVGGGWQSGLMTAGGPGISQPKLALASSATLFALGRAACTRSVVTWSPAARLAMTKPRKARSTP
jgi:hypothetical protein